MAEETQVLKVSLKEYKKQIDDLRASLLALEETDDLYKKNAKEVAEMQSKLNQVMSIGKKNADAAKGSYNDLTNQLAKLKREWKATADAAEQKRLSGEIRKLNDQLGALEQATGDWHRNVGNYGSVWDELGKRGSAALGQIDGALGNTFSMVSQLWPLIQKTTKAAVTGCSTVKAAIISTGIGAIVVILSTILGNLSSIQNALFGVDDEIEKERDITNQILENSKKMETSIRNQSKLMNARGKSQKEILQYQKQEYQNLIGINQARILELQTTYKQIEAQGWLVNLLTGGKRQMKDINEQIKEINDQIKNYKTTIESIDVDIQVADITAGKGGNKVEAASRQIIERLKDYNKEQLQVLKEQYDEDWDLLQKDRKKKLITEKEYLETVKKLNDEYKEKVRAVYQEIINNATTVRDLLQEYGFPPGFKKEQAKKEFDDINSILEEALETEIKLYGTTQEKTLEIQEKYMKLMEINQKKYWETVHKIDEEEVEKNYAIMEKQEKERMEKTIKHANLDYEYSSLDNNGAFDLEAELTKIQQIFEARKEYFDKIIEENQKILENINITSDERILAEQRIKEATDALEEAMTQKTLDEAKKRQQGQGKANKFTIQDAQKTAAAIGGILGTINQAYEDNLRQQLERGEISEEEAEKEFNRTKGLRYMETLMNGASAAIGSFNSLSSIPYVGYALGLAAAASTLAATAIQLNTIKNAKFDSSGNISGGGEAVVVPPIATYAPTESTVDTGQSDVDKLSNALENTTLVVSVSDIEDKSKLQKRRSVETSW